MLTADGQIPSCSRTRHLGGRPGSHFSIYIYIYIYIYIRVFVLYVCMYAYIHICICVYIKSCYVILHNCILSLTAAPAFDCTWPPQGAHSGRACAHAMRKPVLPHLADEFRDIPGHDIMAEFQGIPGRQYWLRRPVLRGAGVVLDSRFCRLLYVCFLFSSFSLFVDFVYC